MTSEELYRPKIVDIASTKISFTVFYSFNMVRAGVMCFERVVEEQGLEFDMNRGS